MRFLFLLLISGSLFGQTYDFNTSAMDGWTLTTGQPNAGWHSPSAMCTNITGSYYDNNNYIFLSPTFDYSNCDNVTYTVNVSYSIRTNDGFFVNFYDAGVLQTSISVASGTTTITAPNTFDQMSFLLTTFASGGSPFRFCHMNWVNIVCNKSLPIELLYFEVAKKDAFNSIEFVTEIEINNDYFIIQRSEDGVFYEDIAEIDGNGSTNTPFMYNYKDYDFNHVVNYYRLQQIDFNGVLTSFNTIVVDNTKKDRKHLKMRLNVLGEVVNEDYKGIIIEVYDNSVVKRLNR